MNDYPKKQQIRVLIGNFDDLLNEGIFEYIETIFKNKYDLKFIASNDYAEISELADKESVDIFILVINNLGPWSCNIVEERMENSLQLIHQIKTIYKKPVIALCGWRKDASVIERAKISADFFFFMPFEWDVFKDAIEKCFEMLPGFESENSNENIRTKFNGKKHSDDLSNGGYMNIYQRFVLILGAIILAVVMWTTPKIDEMMVLLGVSKGVYIPSIDTGQIIMRATSVIGATLLICLALKGIKKE